jgi:hypothetical protein
MKENSIVEDSTKQTVIIVGGGHFGARAAGILTAKKGLALYLVDPEEVALDEAVRAGLELICGDGIAYLVENYEHLSPDTLIVPALPRHLAVEWLLRMPLKGLRLETLAMPPEVTAFLPHHWPGDYGTVLASHADFLCPDDCPEPEDGCTVTGEIRTPLYEILRGLPINGFRTHVIQSHQLAPGLGGYAVNALTALMEDITAHGEAKWLIGTSCRCHGVLTAVGALTLS